MSDLCSGICLGLDREIGASAMLKRMTDRDELSWAGAARPPTHGGFVDGVALNEPTHRLALDPSGVVGSPAPAAGAAGPQLEVERLDEVGSGPVRPSGRVRLMRT